ncbi:MAG: hypothetical protein JSU73_12415 [candidate division WOR-3 bacterium]|nr:MAG: hypothetical protein JSU73_12415 [candidate division WOR-3 bacterium]
MNPPCETPAGRADVVELPFRLGRNKVILPVSVEGSRPLDLILDTGMAFDGVLVYNPRLRDSIELTSPMVVQVPGAGDGPPSAALMTDSGSFSCGEWKAENQRVIVLTDPTMLGMPTDGVVGYSLLGHYAVELDYDSMVIRLHEPGWAPADSGWTLVELSFKDNLIPWVDATLNTRGDKAVDVAAYIDFASSDAVEMMVRPGAGFRLPDGLEQAHLGTGLSGDIHGHKGRIAWFELAGFRFNDVAATFAPGEVRSKQKDADAIIGNGLLCRFNVVFDYSDTSQARLWLRPNKLYRDPF